VILDATAGPLPAASATPVTVPPRTLAAIRVVMSFLVAFIIFSFYRVRPFVVDLHPMQPGAGARHL
jgi:hypothetical protein